MPARLPCNHVLMAGVLVGAEFLVFLGMVAVSAWGWKHLEPETRIRARGGTSGFDWTMSKNTALLWTPLIGLIVLIGTIALGDESNRVTIAWLGLAVMVIFLIVHWSSMRRAAR